VDAIAHEGDGFRRDLDLSKPKPTEVLCSVPKNHAGLQAVDYYLWALQRFYERGEVRYLNFVWPQMLEVLDLDVEPPRKGKKSDWNKGIFNKEHPLTLESRAGVGTMDREI
jgi:hypothetical protein